VKCVVAAPGKIPRAPQDRVKTDRRDAEKLVRLLMAGELHPVRVPATDEEALRDLVRAREDLRGDLMRARHRVGKLLLRHDLRFDGNNWTEAHRDWLARVELVEPVAQLVRVDGIGAIDALLVRRDSLERQMTALVPGSPWATEIARLRCLRGIDTLSALGLCTEIGNFDRFRRPGQLMSYLGMVPSEHTTGDKRRLGSITKSGSRHARRLLVEADWHYRRPPRVGRELARRQDGQPQSVTAISSQAQRRLHQVWQRLDGQRGKRRTIVAETSIRRDSVLHLGQLDFLHGKENVVLLGPPGTGKTHLSIALGIRGCLAGDLPHSDRVGRAAGRRPTPRPPRRRARPPPTRPAADRRRGRLHPV
jgi:transposase